MSALEPDYVDDEGQGWWDAAKGWRVRADPTGSPEHRRVYLTPPPRPMSPEAARHLGRTLIAAADYAYGESQR